MSDEITAGAAIYDLRAKQPISYKHEFTCAGCSGDVWIAVHHGRQDWCLTCQIIGPEATVALRDYQDRRTSSERLSDCQTPPKV